MVAAWPRPGARLRDRPPPRSGEDNRARSFEELARAEDAIRDTLLTAAGRTSGIDPHHESFARKWASAELKEWWDAHGWITFTVFRDRLLSGRGYQTRDVWQWAR